MGITARQLAKENDYETLFELAGHLGVDLSGAYRNAWSVADRIVAAVGRVDSPADRLPIAMFRLDVYRGDNYGLLDDMKVELHDDPPGVGLDTTLRDMCTAAWDGWMEGGGWSPGAEMHDHATPPGWKFYTVGGDADKLCGPSRLCVSSCRGRGMGEYHTILYYEDEGIWKRLAWHCGYVWNGRIGARSYWSGGTMHAMQDLIAADTGIQALRGIRHGCPAREPDEVVIRTKGTGSKAFVHSVRTWYRDDGTSKVTVELERVSQSPDTIWKEAEKLSEQYAAPIVGDLSRDWQPWWIEAHARFVPYEEELVRLGFERTSHFRGHRTYSRAYGTSRHHWHDSGGEVRVSLGSWSMHATPYWDGRSMWEHRVEFNSLEEMPGAIEQAMRRIA